MGLREGSRVGPYEIIAPISLGRSSDIYKAKDSRLGRFVALKVLSSELFSESEKQRLLEHEARLMASLDAPEIASVYDLGQHDGCVYIALELVEGETLLKRIERQPLEIQTVVEIGIQIARALRAAHGQGIIHADLTSSNVILRSDGRVKVLDFGLAKLVSGPDGHGASGISGTFGYLSPEQVQGREPDHRSDLFSLGVVLYEMTARRLPFVADTPAAALEALLDTEPPLLTNFCQDLPLALESIVRKALEKDPEARYQSADAILADLEVLRTKLQPESVPPKITTTLQSPPDPPHHLSTHGGKYLLTAAAVLLVAAIVDSARAGLQLRVLLLVALSTASFLAYKLTRRAGARPRTASPQGAAFRGLLPFQEADSNCFFGREVEASRLCAMVRQADFRFGVLHGDSGCGKTSLLRAGVMPKLRVEGLCPIYCRSYADPLATLIEDCRKRTQIAPDREENPEDYFRRIAGELGADVVLICDQFEEFFVVQRVAQLHDPFVALIASCQRDPDPTVKFLLSIRSDFLHRIDANFGSVVADPLASSKLYCLHNLDQIQAEAIIRLSASRAGLPIEPALVRQLVRDLVTDGAVLPSELQIAGDQLQRRGVVSVDGYQLAGGKESLIYGYLDDVLRTFGKPETAKRMLRSLISDENTRLTLPVAEIAEKVHISPAAALELLNRFLQARLVLEVQDEEPWRYQLMHDYLIEKVNLLTASVMDARQRANRLLGHYLSNYSADRRTRIPLGEIRYIRRYSDRAESTEAQGLLRRSRRGGLIRWSTAGLLVAAVVTSAAAWQSIREEWEAVRLSDGHASAVRQVAFSPNGRLLASAGEDGVVILWDFARRERVATLRGHSGWVPSVAFSPDGRWIASGGQDRKVIVWSASAFTRIAELSGHDREVSHVAFAPDGKLLVSVDFNSTTIWDVDRWTKLRELPSGFDWGNVLFLPDELLLFRYGNAWNTRTGRRITDARFPLLQSYSAASPDGTALASVDPSGSVEFWRLTDGRSLARFPSHREHGHAIAWSPDGRWVASAAENVWLWDAKKREKVLPWDYPAEVFSVAFSPDSRWLVSGHGDGAILVADVKERERVANLNEHSGPVTSVAFARDGKSVASGSEDGTIIVWDTQHKLKRAVLAGDLDRINGLAFSPDGNLIASCHQLGNVVLWDVASRRPLWKTAERSSCYCVAFSADGQYLISSQLAQETSTGRVIAYLEEPRLTATYGLSVSRDGRLLACTSPEGGISLRDVSDWRLREAHLTDPAKEQLRVVAFSPGGASLATGDNRGIVRLWALDPLRQITTIGQHSGRVRSMTFSPDGEHLMTASDDGTIAVWNVRSQSLAMQIGLPGAPVQAIALSLDGLRLVSGTADHAVRFYTRHRTVWNYRVD